MIFFFFVLHPECTDDSLRGLVLQVALITVYESHWISFSPCSQPSSAPNVTVLSFSLTASKPCEQRVQHRVNTTGCIYLGNYMILDFAADYTASQPATPGAKKKKKKNPNLISAWHHPAPDN